MFYTGLTFKVLVVGNCGIDRRSIKGIVNVFAFVSDIMSRH